MNKGAERNLYAQVTKFDLRTHQEQRNEAR